MKKNKIAILLPYKDHFTNLNAGSASIWVKDFNKKSSYKNVITIFGNTHYMSDLIDKKRYINLYLNNYNLTSKNTAYVNQFLKYNKKNNYEIIEIHNRPSYVHQLLKSNINSKVVLIFHNR